MVNTNLGKCSHLFYDFDGVMTDNSVLVDEDGKESVRVNRSDGLAIAELKKRGLSKIFYLPKKPSCY